MQSLPINAVVAYQCSHCLPMKALTGPGLATRSLIIRMMNVSVYKQAWLVRPAPSGMIPAHTSDDHNDNSDDNNNNNNHDGHLLYCHCSHCAVVNSSAQERHSGAQSQGQLHMNNSKQASQQARRQI